MTLPFRPLGSRVVIRADRDDGAPTSTPSGLQLAKTLAAAVDGSDAQDSWFVGTIVAKGPLVNQVDIRPYLVRKLQRLADAPLPNMPLVAQIRALRRHVMALPTEIAGPLRIGDRVCFSWRSGQQICVDEDRYLIMAASDVLAVLSPQEEVSHG